MSVFFQPIFFAEVLLKLLCRSQHHGDSDGVILAEFFQAILSLTKLVCQDLHYLTTLSPDSIFKLSRKASAEAVIQDAGSNQS